MNKPSPTETSAVVRSCPQLSPQDRTGQDRTGDFFLATPSLPTVNVRLGGGSLSELKSRLHLIDAEVAYLEAQRRHLAQLEYERRRVDERIAELTK